MWPFRACCFRSVTVFFFFYVFRWELHIFESTPVRLQGNTFKCPETASLCVERLRHALWPSCPWKRARPSRSRPFIAWKHLWKECHPVIPLQMDLSVSANNLHFGGFAVSTGDFAQLQWSVANIWRALAAGIHRCLSFIGRFRASPLQSFSKLSCNRRCGQFTSGEEVCISVDACFKAHSICLSSLQWLTVQNMCICTIVMLT